MTTTASQRTELELTVTQTVATVSACADDRYVLRTATRSVTARRAASCLLEPQPGDRVLVAMADDAYVLAVLERHEAGTTKLHIRGDAELRLDGALSVTAGRSVSIAGDKLSLLSGRLDVRALDAGIALDRLSVVGSYVQGDVDRIRLSGKSFDTVVDRASQRCARSFRTVTEIDQLRTQQLDMRASSTMRLHARNAITTAKQLLKLDAEQIVMG